MDLPALEKPDPARFEERRAARFTAYWLEIARNGAGYLGLARLDRPKYLALLTIGILAALPYSHP